MAERASAKRRSKKQANGLGHNSSNGDGASEEIFQRWHKKVVAAQGALKRAREAAKTRASELSNIYKAARGEHVNIDMLKSAIRKHEADHLQVLIDARDEAKYLKWIGSPLGTQMSMFPAEEALTDVARAMLAGRSAGLAGRSIDEGNDWKPGSDAFVAFRDAWENGQQTQRETLSG